MKIALFLAVVASLLMGCNTNKQKQKKREYQDSITKVEKRTQEIKDSLEQIRTDSLSLIAWGDAKFGMSQKEVLSTNAFNGSSVFSKETISMKFENKSIANNKMTICNFYAEFEMDELYRIDIKTCPETANYIDDLEIDAMRISHQFEKRYGKPAYSFGKEISLSDFNEGDEFMYERWEIGDKSIYIQFGEVYSGSEYYYRIAIVNSKFPTKKNTEEAKKIQERELKQKEQEKYQF